MTGTIKTEQIDQEFLRRDIKDIYLTGGGSHRGSDIALAQALGLYIFSESDAH